MYSKDQLLCSVLLDGATLRSKSFNRIENEVWQFLSSAVYAELIPHYTRPPYMDMYNDDVNLQYISSFIRSHVSNVKEPFRLAFEEIGTDYIMTLHRPPGKPANLYRKIFTPLIPGDNWILLDISMIMEYFISTTVGIPEFIRLNHEETFVWVLRNLGTSHAHMEFVLNTLMTKVKDDFDRMAYPYDDAVLDLLMTSFSCLLLQLLELLQRFNLFDELGRNWWYVAELNRYEVILYDSRLRGPV